MSVEPSKIFCIGFHKTGTSSLGGALESLGYRVCGEMGVREPRIAEVALELARAQLPHFDAFQDNPWPVLFRELDGECPGSRFILTWRKPDRWLDSICRHFGAHETPMRTWIYGVGHPRGNEQRYKERYEAHNRDVRAWFAERPGDLLEMNLEAGDGWEELCPFLEREVPSTPFPHLNQNRRITGRKRGRRTLFAKLKRVGRKALRSVAPR